MHVTADMQCGSSFVAKRHTFILEVELKVYMYTRTKYLQERVYHTGMSREPENKGYLTASAFLVQLFIPLLESTLAFPCIGQLLISIHFPFLMLVLSCLCTIECR